MKTAKEMNNKEELLTKIEAIGIFRALKKANPNVKKDIKKLRVDIVRGLSRHDRKSGVWFANLYKKTIETRSRMVSLESLKAAYKTEDKELIAKKLTAYYANYGIAVGAILGSSGGVLGFITAPYATFGEIACLTYFKLSLLYDLSVLYERPVDKANNLEIYKILQTAFNINESDLSEGKVDELTVKGTKLMEEKLQRNDSQKHLQGLLKNMGAEIIRKAVKNLMSKLLPIVGVFSGMLVCITLDFYEVRLTSKKVQGLYKDLYKVSEEY